MEELLLMLVCFVGPVLLMFGGFGALAVVQQLSWTSKRLTQLEAQIEALKALGPLTAAPSDTQPAAPDVTPALDATPALAPAPPVDLDPSVATLTPEPSSGTDATDATADSPAAAQASSTAPSDGSAPSAAETTAARATELPSRPSISLDRLMLWGAVGLGSLLVIVAALFAIVAVLQQSWMGPSTRVAIGLAVSSFLWLGGAIFRRRSPVLASGIEGVGISGLTGVLFAGHGYYGLIGSNVAFGSLIAVIAIASARSARYDDRWMAWLALIGGILAPVLISSGSNNPWGLFSYLFLLSSGLLAVAGYRRWPDLIVGVAAGSMMLYGGWTAVSYEPTSVLPGLVAAFALALPFVAVTAIRPIAGTPNDTLTGIVALGGGLVWMWMATPWLVPVAATFTDPGTWVTVYRPAPNLLQLGGTYLLLAPLPLWLVGRFGSRIEVAIGTTCALAVSMLVWGSGWAALSDSTHLVLVGTCIPVGVASALHLGARRQGLAWPLLAAPLLVVVPALTFNGLSPTHIGILLGMIVVGLAISAHVSTIGSVFLVLTGLVGPLLAVIAFGSDIEQVLPLTGAAVALLVVPPLASTVRSWSTDPFPQGAWLGGLLAIPAAFPALYWGWEQTLGTEWIGALPVLVGTFAVVPIVLLTRVQNVRIDRPIIALAVAIVLAGVTFALPIQVDQKWLTIGWALEAAALALLAPRLKQPLMLWGAVALSLVVGFRLLGNPYALAWGDTAGWPILNWTLYSWGVPTVCLGIVAHQVRKAAPTGVAGPVSGVLYIIAMFTGFALVNVQVSHAFQDAGPVELGGNTLLEAMVRSLAWGGWGLLLMVVGFIWRQRMPRMVGFGFMLLAACKVLVYDIWSLPGFIRVGSLLGLGLTLLLSAFLFERLVLRDLNTDPES